MAADIEECIITELSETETSDPKNKIKIRVENLIFEDIPTLISNVQFELALDDKESFHTRQNVKTNKEIPAHSFIHEFNLVEKRLEECCKRFDKVKTKYSE
jgi:hypothetical protein